MTENANDESKNVDSSTTEIDTQAAETNGNQESGAPEAQEKSRAAKRINQLTYEKKAQKAEFDAIVNELKSEIQGLKSSVSKPQELTLEAFDYDETKYQEALIDKKVNDKLAALEESRKAQEQKQAIQRNQQEYGKRNTAYAVENPEYAELLQTMSSAVTSETVANFLITSDEGPKVQHQLLKDVNELYRIQSLPEWQQGAELARLEAKVSQVKTKEQSKAPDPVSPLNNETGATIGKPKGAVRDFKLPFG